jgi:cysteine desulfurase
VDFFDSGLKRGGIAANLTTMYLDANATSPLAEEVWEAMMPWWRDGFHNPSSVHTGGKKAREALEQARGQVADLIGAQEDEIVFTSGGTESINALLRSWDALGAEGYFLTTAVEHSAVLRSGEALSRPMLACGVNEVGALDLSTWQQHLSSAAFASAMAVNNETGVIMDWQQASTLAQQYGVPFFCDAVQALGKIPFSVQEGAVDAMALSAHKFHGPKGVGALYVRRGTRFAPLLHGGGQERGLRSGTEALPLIVGMGAAAVLAKGRLSEGTMANVSRMRDAFEQAVLAGVTGVRVNGDPSSRVPNTSHLSFDQCEAAGLLILLDEKGVACSAGSACMSGKQHPSHVQKAMGFSDARAKSSLRFSLSAQNTMEEAIQAAAMVCQAVKKLRSVQGDGVGPVVIYTP